MFIFKFRTLVIGHERLHKVNKLLRDHKVGGLACYDIKGRGRAKKNQSQLVNW